MHVSYIKMVKAAGMVQIDQQRRVPAYAFFVITISNLIFQVAITCGTETVLTSASEPARCEYLFEMQSPAACPDPATISTQLNHEEL